MFDVVSADKKWKQYFRSPNFFGWDQDHDRPVACARANKAIKLSLAEARVCNFISQDKQREAKIGLWRFVTSCQSRLLRFQSPSALSTLQQCLSGWLSHRLREPVGEKSRYARFQGPAQFVTFSDYVTRLFFSSSRSLFQIDIVHVNSLSHLSALKEDFLPSLWPQWTVAKCHRDFRRKQLRLIKDF